MSWAGSLTALVAAGVFSGVVRGYALRAGILDVPNARSSHSTPVPRGGGLAVVAAMLLGMAAAVMSGAPMPGLVSVALAGLLVVAATGWVDDRRGSSVGARFAAHLGAALTLLPLALVPATIPEWMGWAAAGWWIFWSVSAVNVVNFMDGIDGLIGTQSLVFGLYILLMAGTGVGEGPSAAFGGVLMGASAGFLLWNWPPAKIFLGDVGSGALGFAMVLGGVLLMRESGVGVARAFLPLYPIFLDATATLVARRMRGERLTEAHRSHLYQRLANGGWGHGRVTFTYGVMSLVGVLVGVADLRYRGLWVAAYFATVAAVGAWMHRSHAAGKD